MGTEKWMKLSAYSTVIKQIYSSIGGFKKLDKEVSMLDSRFSVKIGELLTSLDGLCIDLQNEYSDVAGL